MAAIAYVKGPLVLSVARDVYPSCYLEGSTGPERTIWNGDELVGHAWPSSRDWLGPYVIRLRW